MVSALLFLLFHVQDDAAGLIEQLRSDSVEQRDAAARKLADLGRAALPALEKAGRHPDREVVARARRIRRIIELRGELSPELRKHYPGIEERLDDNSRAATIVFLDLPEPPSSRDGPPEEEERPDPFPMSDLRLLARLAVRGANGKELTTVTQRVLERRITEAAPEYVPLLDRPEEWARATAVVMLGRLGYRAAIPGIFKVLEDPRGNNRSLAADALVELKAVETVPRLRKQLKHLNPDIRSRAAELLGEFGDAGSVPDLLAMVRGSDIAGGSALHSLARLGCREAVPFLLGVMATGNENTRRAALADLIVLRAPEAAPYLLPKLRDASALVRGQAIQSLGEIGDPTLIPAVSGFLKDPEPFVAGSAMVTLAGMGYREHVPLILEALRAQDSNRQWFAVRSLGALRNRDHVGDLIRLLDSTDIELRWAVIRSLGEIGAPDSIPALRPHLVSRNAKTRELAESAIRRIQPQRK